MRAGLEKLRTLLALSAVLMAPGTPYAEAPIAPTEYQVKAAFLYNFIKFVEWPAPAPAEPGVSFVVGVIGKDPFGDTLAEELNGNTIDGKPLTLKHPSTLEDAAACDVLFISASEQTRLAVILDALRGHAVLTVSDIPRFIHHGGIIGFSLEDGRVRFSINRGAAAAEHLTVSSQLLKLAKTVRDAP